MAAPTASAQTTIEEFQRALSDLPHAPVDSKDKLVLCGNAGETNPGLLREGPKPLTHGYQPGQKISLQTDTRAGIGIDAFGPCNVDPALLALAWSVQLPAKMFNDPLAILDVIKAFLNALFLKAVVTLEWCQYEVALWTFACTRMHELHGCMLEQDDTGKQIAQHFANDPSAWIKIGFMQRKCHEVWFETSQVMEKLVYHGVVPHIDCFEDYDFTVFIDTKSEKKRKAKMTHFVSRKSLCGLSYNTQDGHLSHVNPDQHPDVLHQVTPSEVIAKLRNKMSDVKPAAKHTILEPPAVHLREYRRNGDVISYIVDDEEDTTEPFDGIDTDEEEEQVRY